MEIDVRALCTASILHVIAHQLGKDWLEVQKAGLVCQVAGGPGVDTCQANQYSDS